MFITPRLYDQYLAQRQHDQYEIYVGDSPSADIGDEQLHLQNAFPSGSFSGNPSLNPLRKENMLLLHQIGSVKVGEVVRYTLTYTPSLDRILPPPQQLHVKVKNTSAIPLRAAYLHGPYTLYASCYPSTFDPYVRHDRVKEEGGPEYEPQIKAGGSWTGKLTVPEEVRADIDQGSRTRDKQRKSFTWIIEVASQVLFSTTATVHYELLVGRDEKSVGLGVTGVVSVGHGQGLPGKLEDVQSKRSELKSEVQARGVFSKAVRLAVDDTESLWNTPPFPSWDNQGKVNVKQGPEHGDKRDVDDKKEKKQKKQKKIHLVILTHGLHSNLGADMLYLKESIDSAAKQAKEDARQRRAELRSRQAQQDNEFGRDAARLSSKSVPDITIAPTPAMDDEDEDDDEQVLVRGFNGNAIKTEKGIQYLGKRLAKYVLSITYPDQPFLPVKNSLSRSITRSLTGQKLNEDFGLKPIHKNSSIVKDVKHQNHNLAYKITKISFIGHSLGGLTQTYAAAYIHKHSPEFFERIEPVNFIALASPFLGLSNENPVYVKFALDFGLVGRTGQDLGLTWRAPTIARSGWSSMVNGLVNDPHKNRQPDPAAKPLLRILPTGPAHQALKKFRNRTVYSNVVNDGIVPLRTSCLLFLDWRGLGRVEKARRENGFIGTMVNWGWNEMTGENVSTAKKLINWHDSLSDDADNSSKHSDDPGSTVPDARASQFIDEQRRESSSDDGSIKRQRSNPSNAPKEDAKEQESNVWNGFLAWFRPQAASRPHEAKSTSPKVSHPKQKRTPKMLQRGQVMSDDSAPPSPDRSSVADSKFDKPRGPVRGSSLYTNNSAEENMEAPPTTTVFESAGDLLAPPLPPKEYLLDPAARPRTIFHDRVYHPDDIPPPPSKRQKAFMGMGSRRNSHDLTVPNQDHSDLDKTSSAKPEGGAAGGMRIEEKIARAYHKDMSWRKVLVSMEPDAHNNMIVRRMFANAYGWPVVKHMCDTHFAFTATAQTRDDEENTEERAKPSNEAVGSTGEQVKGQVEPPDDAEFESARQKHEENRSKSVDDASTHHSLGPERQRASKQALRSLSDRVRFREQKGKTSSRSSSEVREARDEVTDLVSMTSVTATGSTSTAHSASSHSGTAALHRLARQDSGRWSDRFFEGSDNDSDDDDTYFDQLRRARERDQIITSDKDGIIRIPSNSYEPRSITSAGSDTSSQKEKSPKLSQTGRLLTDSVKLVSEPDAMTPTSRQHSRDEPDPKATSLVGLGLGKTTSGPILEIAGDHEDTSHKGHGVAEQVARATVNKGVDKDNK